MKRGLKRKRRRNRKRGRRRKMKKDSEKEEKDSTLFYLKFISHVYTLEINPYTSLKLAQNQYCRFQIVTTLCV